MSTTSPRIHGPPLIFLRLGVLGLGLPVALVLLCAGVAAPAAASTMPLLKVADILLPGPTGRFDYAAQDPQTGSLWFNQMGADRTLVFDPKASRVTGTVQGLATPTGITLAPERRLAFISNAGNLLARAAGHGSVSVIDLDTLKPRVRLPVGHFPDGSAWVPQTGRLFVSNELGGSETVIGGDPPHRLRSIELGGEAGMSAYDPIDHRVLVNVQTRNWIAAIDPHKLKVVARTTLPSGCRHNHGLLVDARDRLAFVACDGNARLLVLSLSDLRSVQSPLKLGEDPDVLALDPRRHRLVVAAESGVVTVFAVLHRRVAPLWRGPVGAHAHVVAIDSATGLLYFPLEDLNGRPVLRVMRLVPPARP